MPPFLRGRDHFLSYDISPLGYTVKISDIGYDTPVSSGCFLDHFLPVRVPGVVILVDDIRLVILFIILLHNGLYRQDRPGHGNGKLVAGTDQGGGIGQV